MRIGGIRADAQFSCRIFNKQLIDLIIFEVFLNFDNTIDNNDDNVQEIEKDTEVCRDLFRFWLVFFIFQDASYNLGIVIFNRTAFRQKCCPNPIQSIIPRPGGFMGGWSSTDIRDNISSKGVGTAAGTELDKITLF